MMRGNWWRRVLVPAAIRLDRLHEVIQAAMGWQNCHVHAFTAADASYGRPERELGHRDERQVRLSDLVGVTGSLAYEYDFGDGWEHQLYVEVALPAEADRRYPACVAGAGACPPEDCGGPWGYQDLKEVIADPARDEHEPMLGWLGLETAADFDATHFDVAAADQRLAMLGTDEPAW